MFASNARGSWPYLQTLDLDGDVPNYNKHWKITAVNGFISLALDVRVCLSSLLDSGRAHYA
jgi:hypothetical protein